MDVKVSQLLKNKLSVVMLALPVVFGMPGSTKIAKAVQQNTQQQSQQASKQNETPQSELAKPAQPVKLLPRQQHLEELLNNGTLVKPDLRQSIIADLPLFISKEMRVVKPYDDARGESPFKSSLTFIATAYSIHNVTACGVMARTGIIAADPKVIPLGSIVKIEAGKYSGVYRVLDTGPAIKGNRIDIYMPCRADAIQFGRRKINVEIVRWGWRNNAQPPHNALTGE